MWYGAEVAWHSCIHSFIHSVSSRSNLAKSCLVNKGEKVPSMSPTVSDTFSLDFFFWEKMSKFTTSWWQSVLPNNSVGWELLTRQQLHLNNNPPIQKDQTQFRRIYKTVSNRVSIAGSIPKHDTFILILFSEESWNETDRFALYPFSLLSTGEKCMNNVWIILSVSCSIN